MLVVFSGHKSCTVLAEHGALTLITVVLITSLSLGRIEALDSSTFPGLNRVKERRRVN